MPRGINQFDEDRLDGLNFGDANSSNIVSPGIVTDGLVLHLDAGNYQSYPIAGTSWYDLSQYQNTGTLTSGPTYSNSGGGSIVFDGVDDYIIDSSTNNMPLGASSRTVQIWFYPTSNTSNLVQIGGGSGQKYIISSYLSGFDSITYLFTDGVNTQNNISISGSEIPTLNGWHNFVFGNTGQSWFYYLDNKLTKSGTFPITLNTVTQKYVIADRDDTTDPIVSTPLQGNVAQVLIYNRSLTPTEISQNFNATRARFNI